MIGPSVSHQTPSAVERALRDLNEGKLQAEFVDQTGRRAQGQEAIVPILAVTARLKPTCIGTGFFISKTGLFATAAHVVRDIRADFGPEAGLLILQHIPPMQMLMREVNQCTMHTRADVAVGTVKTEINPTTNLPYRNAALRLTTAIPQLGADILTWAYPNCVTDLIDTGYELALIPKAYIGRIVEEHRDGRDRVMLPGPCYLTDLGIGSGASGGPVIDCSSKDVFAINSTGFEGTTDAYVSHIQKIGGLPINNYVTAAGDQFERITVSELIRLGDILSVDTPAAL